MPRGGPIGADDGTGPYRNEIETDRMLVRERWGGTGSHVVRGLTLSPSISTLTLDIAAGAAKLAGAVTDDQGDYLAWSIDQESVAWPAPSASSRIDALVLMIRDSQYGALAVGEVNGPEWVVVEGTPAGSPVAPTDAQITTAVGVGAWLRHADVRIDPGDIVIAAGNITVTSTNVEPGFTTTVYAADATWVKPVGVRFVDVICVGGGGSGGGAHTVAAGEQSIGSGGGGGGYARRLIPAALLTDTVAVAVGAGGSASPAGGVGNAGGTSSFGSFLSATGGAGGVDGQPTTGFDIQSGGLGGGGTAPGGIVVHGGDGGNSRVVSGAIIPTADGGGTVLAGRSRCAVSSNSGGSGNEYGGGSSGATNYSTGSARPSRAGADGVVIVNTYYY